MCLIILVSFSLSLPFPQLISLFVTSLCHSSTLSLSQLFVTAHLSLCHSSLSQLSAALSLSLCHSSARLSLSLSLSLSSLTLSEYCSSSMAGPFSVVVRGPDGRLPIAPIFELATWAATAWPRCRMMSPMRMAATAKSAKQYSGPSN